MNFPIMGVGAPQNAVPNKTGEKDTAGARRLPAVRRGDVPVKLSSSGQGKGISVLVGATVAPLPTSKAVAQVEPEQEGREGGGVPPSAGELRRAAAAINRVPAARLEPAPAIKVPAGARPPTTPEAAEQLQGGRAAPGASGADKDALGAASEPHAPAIATPYETAGGAHHQRRGSARATTVATPGAAGPAGVVEPVRTRDPLGPLARARRLGAAA